MSDEFDGKEKEVKILVVGATGRVGTHVVDYALAAGHDVIAYVRNASKMTQMHPTLHIVEGEITNRTLLIETLMHGVEIVINVVGGPVTKPTTIVTDTARALIEAMELAGVTRYLGITGIAEMTHKTIFGSIVTAILRLSPIGHAVRDHDAAYRAVKATGFDWTLAACPYIKDGTLTKKYRLSHTFTGGFKTISPQDVADFLVREVTEHRYTRQEIGIWY